MWKREVGRDVTVAKPPSDGRDTARIYESQLLTSYSNHFRLGLQHGVEHSELCHGHTKVMRSKISVIYCSGGAGEMFM